MRCVSYTRAVSCMESGEIPKDIISQQNQRIQDYIKKRGWTLGKKYSDRRKDAFEETAYLQMKMDAKHCKYSVSDGRYKIYNHKLYKLLLTDPPESMRDNIFEIDGTKYLWMLFEELEVDLNTMQKNDDVIAFVKSKI